MATAKSLRKKIFEKKNIYNGEGSFESTISRKKSVLLFKKMSETSVSWIGLGLSALLIIDKLVSKSKKVKCKCCGSEFEASELDSPMQQKNNTQLETVQIAETNSIK